MTKHEMVNHMEYYLRKMKKLLEKSGVPEDYLEIPLEAYSLKADFIRPGFNWLLHIFNNAFREADRIWSNNFMTEDVWARMEARGETEMEEVVEFRKALIVLRMTVRTNKRPDFFKKGKMERAIKNASHKKTSSKSS